MKIPEILKQSDKTQFSFELLPPLKGGSIKDIYEVIDPLMEFKPPYINVTYHQEEIVLKKLQNGLLQQKTVRKRPGTVAMAAAIKNKYKVELVPHLICGGFSKEETENALIDLNFLGINNLLALRGDIQAGQKRFMTAENGHSHALGLVEQITDLNKAKYLDEELHNKQATNFSVGVAGYPEKHPEAPNMEMDIFYLKKKIEAGAEFIVTQMFFDNQKYFDFVELCKKNGINVPIIPGIKPISAGNQLSVLPKIFSIDIPEALTKEIVNCTNKEHIKKVGIDWAVQQSKELKNAGVPVIHYYTMGRATNVYEIAKQVF